MWKRLRDFWGDQYSDKWEVTWSDYLWFCIVVRGENDEYFYKFSTDVIFICYWFQLSWTVMTDIFVQILKNWRNFDRGWLLMVSVFWKDFDLNLQNDQAVYEKCLKLV